MNFDGIIFVPGMMCDARLFGPQIESFQAHYQIEVALPVHDETIELSAERILRETRFRFFALAGLSLGGMVAMEMARREPARITRLALMDTTHLTDTEMRSNDRQRQMNEVRAGGLGRVMAQEQKPLYVAPQNLGDAELNSVFMEMAQELGPEIFLRQSKMLINRGDATGSLLGFKRPSLVLCGAHDKVCPPSLHEDMKALLDYSELVVVPDAGHLPTLENPMAVNTALRWWLRAQ